MRNRVIGLLCFGLMASLATNARANFVVNGNFAAPNVSGSYANVPFGATTITGWTVISGQNDPGLGSVDLLGTSFIAPHAGATAGSQTVDLDGTSTTNAAGGLQQTIGGLTSGVTYTLDFFYTNNYNAPSASAMVTIDNLSFSMSHSGATQANPGYLEATLTFIGTGTNILQFYSLDPANDQSGIIIDSVSINPTTSTPEPASIAMLGLGSPEPRPVPRDSTRPRFSDPGFYYPPIRIPSRRTQSSRLPPGWSIRRWPIRRWSMVDSGNLSGSTVDHRLFAHVFASKVFAWERHDQV
jgi:hypothetical protein